MPRAKKTPEEKPNPDIETDGTLFDETENDAEPPERQTLTEDENNAIDDIIDTIDIDDFYPDNDEIPEYEALPDNKPPPDNNVLSEEPEEPVKQERPQRIRRVKSVTAVRKRTEPILTIESGDEVETPEERDAAIWHDIQNAYRTKKVLTGMLGGMERLESNKTIAVVYYRDLRVVIPLDEMMINVDMQGQGRYNYGDLILRKTKILGNMLGAQIDFMVKGIDARSRSVVASRKDAMLKKRKTFYMDTDLNGKYKIYAGRTIQARIIAVSDKAVRVDAFGVEYSVSARDLSWDWLVDARDHYHIGGSILLKVTEVINRETIDKIEIKADARSLSGNSEGDNLKKCRVQGKYAGKVTGIHKGVVFVRLNIGVNAVAHSCMDNKMPGKKDDVCFAITHIDEEQKVAVGIITRIIKQNY